MMKIKPRKFFYVLIFMLICSVVAVLYAYDKTYTAYMAGNSHIDTAWQWTTSTTRTQYVPNTFNQAMNLMNANPDYTFNASAALHYSWIQSDNPTLFNNIKTKVTNGQWNLVGGNWIEADTNITGGEAQIRQHLYGQRYFYQNFGRYCTVGWLPDCFGFTAQFPQILKGCGMDYFVTTKLNWNDTNQFPYELFKWNALDGSQVITYKPRQDYSVGTGSSTDIQYVLDEPNRHSIKKGLLLYGSGDAGGGPTQTDVNNIRSYDGNSSLSNVKMYSANKYFADLTSTDKANITDSWTGYMYLENHRGTYTSQAKIKKNNRVGEVLAEEAEKLSSIAAMLGAKTYDSSNIRNGWNLVMLNQFHDILPGSGTNNQVVEAKNNGAAAINTFNSVINAAQSAIASKIDTTVSSGVPIIVFNPLSFGRKYPVQTSVTFPVAPTSLKVYDNGTEIPCQMLSTSGNTATIVFILDNIPSFGYKVVQAVANTGNYSGTNLLSIGNNLITSDKFQITINSSNGNISSILDKTNNRQVMTGEGNILQILDDTPANWDAWNVDYDDMTRAPLSTCTKTGITIVENGPAKCTYRVDKTYGSSSFSQYITLYAGIDKIDIRMTANWNESHKMVKVAFPWNVSGATSVMYDEAYGVVSNPNTMTQGKFEIPAQKWADLSAGGYGVALLNDCKYGYDCNGNIMRLSLLRSPKSPDATCDMGSDHDFTYSIYPHSGDWKSANSMYKGWELNYQMMAYPTTSHTGTLGKSASFMSINAANVIISALKKAEDSNEYIVRMYETQGSSANPTITMPGTITAISETDMLERNISTPAYSGNTFSTSLSAFKIKTYKVTVSGVNPGPTPTVGPTPTPGPTSTPMPTPTQPPAGTDLCTGGTASASGENSAAGEGAAQAFDDNTGTKWLVFASTGWLQYDFSGTTAYAVNQYTVTSANDATTYSGRNPKNWTLQGSNDGSTWTTVDTRTNISFTANFQKQTFSFTNSTKYQMYRLNVTANNGGTEVQLSEMEMFAGSNPTPTPTPTTGPTPTPVPVSFTDNFNDNAIAGAWSLYGSGTWSEQGTILRQDSTAQGDPCKVIISNSGKTFGSNHTILAKVYVNSWTDGDSARAGVSLFTGTSNGQGYNLLFHNNHSTVQFLDDATAWGPSYTFNWTNQTWYWFKLQMSNGTLYGKVWQDGLAEPSSWQFTWARSGRIGYPALNGGTSGHGGFCTVYFDDVTVTAP